MAVNVNTVKERVELLCAQDQRTTYLNADKFNKYAPIALRKILIQQRTQFEATSMSSDALSGLKKTAQLNISSDGTVSKPTDYLYYDSIYLNVFYKDKRGKVTPLVNPVDLVKDNEVSIRRGSLVSPPTKQWPIVSEQADTFTFWPGTTGIATFNYIREPLIPFWNYTVDDNEQVYAATSGSATNPNSGVTAGDSTDFELPPQFENDLVWTICEEMGVTVREPELLQASQGLNQKP